MTPDSAHPYRALIRAERDGTYSYTTVDTVGGSLEQGQGFTTRDDATQAAHSVLTAARDLAARTSEPDTWVIL